MNEPDATLPLTAEEFRRVRTLFETAITLAPPERLAFLKQECEGHVRLEEEVLRMLGAESSVNTLLDTGLVSDLVGARLGPYEVIAPIGTGGMGEVFHAYDTALNREVALKVLPAAFSTDADRRSRFAREANILAALTHPNITTLYAFEALSDPRQPERHLDVLVMELVEGTGLSERIKQGPISTADALAIGRQIAAALDAAHEQGVIHRDLKPANIKIRPDGTVKLFDFGLAKGGRTDVASPIVSNPGVFLGTAAYVSPEQARGQQVDLFSDNWAFGCVLYEMLTGTRAFAGTTAAETIAAVLTREPNWDTVPERVRPLVQRCLQKEPRLRTRNVTEALAWIEVGSSESRPLNGRPNRRLVWLAAGAAAVIVAVAVVFLTQRETTSSPAFPIRLQLVPPRDVTVAAGSRFSISPDGRLIAFVGAAQDGIYRIWIRALDNVDARPLSGTEFVEEDFLAWSPDGTELAFGAEHRLKTIKVTGGPARTLCLIQVSMTAVGASWGRGGVIIFGQNGGGLVKASVADGSCSPLTTLAPFENQHVFPSFLPDGRHFLFLRSSLAGVAQRNDRQSDMALYTGILDEAPSQERSRRLLATRNMSTFLAASDHGPGQLLFVRDRTLMAQRFDADRLSLTGEAVPIAEPIATLFADAMYAASDGAIAYRTSAVEQFQLVWFDRDGRNRGTVGEPMFMRSVSLSRDGKRALYTDLASAGLWLLDVETGTRRRVASGSSAVWSPDGRHVAFIALRAGEARTVGLYVADLQDMTGGERLATSAVPSDWTPDGRFLIYTQLSSNWNADLWAVPLDGAHTPIPIAVSRFDETDAKVSPDGRLIAFSSNESGRYEVQLRPFELSSTPNRSSVPIVVSRGGGNRVFGWRADGRELWYRTADNAVMAVEVQTTPRLKVGEPRLLFRKREVLTRPDGGMVAATDGSRFLMAVPVHVAGSEPFTIVLNWQSLLK